MLLRGALVCNLHLNVEDVRPLSQALFELGETRRSLSLNLVSCVYSWQDNGRTPTYAQRSQRVVFGQLVDVGQGDTGMHVFVIFVSLLPF